MFGPGIGFFETIVIILVIIIVIRPKDLPKFFYKVGKIIGQLREYYNMLTRQIRNMEYEFKKNMTLQENKKDEDLAYSDNMDKGIDDMSKIVKKKTVKKNIKPRTSGKKINKNLKTKRNSSVRRNVTKK